MTFIQKLKAVFGKLNFTDKAKKKEMTAADWNAVRAAYLEEYGVELSADQEAYQSAQAADSAQDQERARVEAENLAALGILNSALENVEVPTNSSPDGNSIVAAATQIAQAFTQMSKTPIPDIAPTVGGAQLSANGPGHTAEYFCGIPHPMFAMTHRHNRVALNPALAASEKIDSDKYGQSFRSDLRDYSNQLSERIDTLRVNNMLNPALLTAGVSISIAPDGLGDQYLVRRMDQLIARLAAIKNVYDIFPRRFGVQDREVMVNAFIGDFSQAYQKGSVWKGNIELKPEVCYVDDAMFKTLFNSMKEIERQYIGYLNKEGSDPIKWTMIEWAMLQISTKLIEEQNQRKLLGIFVKPEDGKPGHILNAGTGVYHTILRYYNEGKMALLDNAAFSSYTSGSTMVGVVTNMLATLAETVPDLDKYEVILNANHRAKWLVGIREVYGKDNDFTGPKGDTVPDLGNVIRWAPYLGQLPWILVQEPGNIQSIENEAGEMHNVKFDADMEDVKSWSTWKEGTSAAYVGRQFPSKAERKEHGFDEQVIFSNCPSVQLAANATSVEVSGDIRMYVTSANDQATVITDITGAKPGFAYQIEIGSAENPSTIAKTGRFTGITAAFTPIRVGDYVLVILNSAGDKFLELERCVNGTRKINTELQPNVPGGR